MEIKRRSIISVALIIAMIFTVAAFTSCSNSEAEQSVTINIKIAGSTEIPYEGPALIKAVPSEMTVLTATQQLCTNLDIVFDYDKDIDTVKQIGSDISELFASESDKVEEEAAEGEVPAANEEEAAEEETTDADEVVKDYYYDWVCSLNGAEAKLDDKIKEGDSLVWEWKEVKKELKEN